MGRLSLVMSVGLISALAGCETTNPHEVSHERAEAVVATQTNVPTPLSSIHSDISPPGRTLPRHSLCERQAKPRPWTIGKLETVRAVGESLLPERPAAPAGRWSWINVWAAYCGPCKEEIPRLLGWEDKLSKAGNSVRLSFVSLDDDKRQLVSFLDGQPSGGLRVSYWLPEGGVRDAWLTGLRWSLTPSLPFHVLINPKGELACMIDGALDPEDFGQLAALVSQK